MGLLDFIKKHSSSDPHSKYFVDPVFITKLENVFKQKFVESRIGTIPGFVSEDEEIFVCADRMPDLGADPEKQHEVDLPEMDDRITIKNNTIKAQYYHNLKDNFTVESIMVNPYGESPIVFQIESYFVLVAPLLKSE